ncbi:Protein kinase-like domain [Pseudocohnilembus persalinus]|uniref:non-specific serine/threonine protein kinase n=1 Tax=Pseudocohnilembus persalinus TaxID=266149 RepID=A0A0V0QH69_PSEPJ|nr:Protein kinase-like domain [Pseudocohnilembus persalinus]|eukprot:KRX01524.1 Protein kinase-like domain [Pseudocohnilembus persalinus]
MKIIDVSKLDRKQKEDALNEVKLLKQLKHPFIIQYRESFMDQNRYLCIVMDYAEKGDVHSLILQKKKSKEQFTEQEILKYFIQICFGLKFIHDQNILHRDLKTQNIFLNQKSEIKIGDFGIAKTLKNQDDMAQTAIGTPYYLSPEICEEKAYNQKSDIWSLGCILYEFMTQKHAFDAQNMRGLMIKILKAQYQKIPENLNFSDEIKNLVYELLQKDPENRPSIKDILKKPFLQPVIDQFLSQKLKEKKETQEKQNKKENKSSSNQFQKKNQSEIIQRNDNKEQNNSSSTTNVHQQSQQQFQLNSCRSILQSDRSKQSEIIKNEQLINQIQNLNNENYIPKIEPKQKQQNNENNKNSSDTEQVTFEQPNQQYLQYVELIQGVITIENSIFSN